MYEELLNKLKKYDSDMAVCKYKICKGKKNIFLNSEFKEDVIKEEKIIPMFLQGEVLTAHLWNKLYKKRLFKDLKFNKYNMLEDMDIMYLVLERCKRISYIDEEYYYYVYNNMSLTRQYNISMLSDFQQVIMQMFKHYDNRDDIKKYLNYNKTMLICTLFENIAKSNTKLSNLTKYKNIYKIFKMSLIELRKKDKVLYNKFTRIQKLKINILNFNVKIFIIFNRIMRGMIKI